MSMLGYQDKYNKERKELLCLTCQDNLIKLA